MKNKSLAFWVTNISNRNVSLTDLNLTIKAFTSVNLLDNRHYSYNSEQLKDSATKGSLFKKSNMLVIRKLAPEIMKMNVPFNKETFIPSRERSVLSIKEENYEELNVSDESFAEENAETAQLDTQPMLKKV